MDRLDKLPGRELTLSADLMEVAFSHEGRIYLAAYSPRAGAPADGTKHQFDVALTVLNADGTDAGLTSRPSIHVAYDDPSLGTDRSVVEQILDNVQALTALAHPWAERQLSTVPLHEQLRPSGGTPPA